MTWKIELELFFVKFMVNRNYHIVCARLILFSGVKFVNAKGGRGKESA